MLSFAFFCWRSKEEPHSNDNLWFTINIKLRKIILQRIYTAGGTCRIVVLLQAIWRKVCNDDTVTYRCRRSALARLYRTVLTWTTASPRQLQVCVVAACELSWRATLSANISTSTPLHSSTYQLYRAHQGLLAFKYEQYIEIHTQQRSITKINNVKGVDGRHLISIQELVLRFRRT